jgi:hypothetical protein
MAGASPERDARTAGVAVEPYCSDALWQPAKEPPEEQCFLWIDIFSLNQHGDYSVKRRGEKEWLTKHVRALVGACHATILVFDPWRKPLVIRRSRCLFETMAALAAGRRVSVQLSEAERPGFDEAMIASFEDIARSFSRIECSKGRASDEKGGSALQQAIAEAWGGEQCDITVKKCLREWLAGITEARVTQLDATLGRDHRTSLHLRTNMALLLQSRKKYDTAEAVLEGVLARRERKHGRGHKATLSTRCMLGWINKSRARHLRARVHLQAVLDDLTRTRGPDHSLTVTALQNVAAVTKALAWDAMGAGWRHRKKGEKIRKASHAELDEAQAWLDKARPMYEAVAEARRENNGEGHTLHRLALSAVEHVAMTQEELDSRRKDLVEWEREQERKRRAAEESDEEIVAAREASRREREAREAQEAEERRRRGEQLQFSEQQQETLASSMLGLMGRGQSETSEEEDLSEGERREHLDRDLAEFEGQRPGLA